MASFESLKSEDDNKRERNSEDGADGHHHHQGTDDDGDDGDGDGDVVNLGFLEETDTRLLRSHMFPSKVGGWPAWLSLSPLPRPDLLRCRVCSGPCIFLLQVYAPINRLTRAFHRTLFVFVCRSGACNRRRSAENFRVFRSQLPRVNRFYSCEPPPLLLRPPPPGSSASSSSTSTSTSTAAAEKHRKGTTTTSAASTSTSNTNSSTPTAADHHHDDVDSDDGGDGAADDSFDADLASDEAPSAVMYQSLCVVCGAAGPKRCGGCLNVTYCGKQHQTVDWRYGHRNVCKNRSNTHPGGPSRDQPGVLFKEYELVTETEELSGSDNNNGDDEEEEDSEDGGGGDGPGNRSVVKARPKKHKIRGGGHLSDLESYARKETSDDKEFLKFRRRVRNDPEQVLRYQLGGEVLWVSSENKPSMDSIPPCPTCGAQRIFEFQVLPQLLSHLSVDLLEDSLDWGSLLVYTCSNSCDIDVQYVDEFLWKQDYSTKDS